MGENTKVFFNSLCLVDKASVYSESIINSKTIIEFGSRRISEIFKASVWVIYKIAQTPALKIPHILLDLIQ